MKKVFLIACFTSSIAFAQTPNVPYYQVDHKTVITPCDSTGCGASIVIDKVYEIYWPSDEEIFEITNKPYPGLEE